MNLIFDTDLEPRIDGRAFTSCFVTDVNGTLVPRDAGRGCSRCSTAPEAGERPADFDDEQVRTLVRRAAGRDDVRADLFDARVVGGGGVRRRPLPIRSRVPRR